MPDNAISKDDLAEYERALKETGVDMAPFEYAKKCVLASRFADEVADTIGSAG